MILLNRLPKRPTRSRRDLRPGIIGAARSATAIFRPTCSETTVRSPGSGGFAGSANWQRRQRTINRGLDDAIEGGDSIIDAPLSDLSDNLGIRGEVSSSTRWQAARVLQ